MLGLLSKEMRLVFYVMSLYAIFITWGYLQEKITASDYTSSLEGSEGMKMRWDYPSVLNVCMSASAALSAALVEHMLQNANKEVTFMMFWKSSLSAALASPIGYKSLKYISYPLMILTKSSKPVPVMAVGILFYKQSYPWYKYVSVIMICAGISLYTFLKDYKAEDHASSHSLSSILFGLFLVLLNLSLDGVTSNEQDQIFKEKQATSMQMMKNTNAWQAIYLTAFLVLEGMFNGGTSVMARAVNMIHHCPMVLYDILIFCICGCVGQLMLFGLIKEFGSLVWITVSVTRQLFTILLSVFIFNHHVKLGQWFGIVLVFSGLGLEILLNYRKSSKKKD